MDSQTWSHSARLLGTIALLSLLILAFAGRARDNAPLIAPSSALTGSFADPVSGAVAGGAALVGVAEPRGAALAVQIGVDFYNAQDEARLRAELERAQIYVSRRFGAVLSQRTDLHILREPTCGLHGIAYTGERRLQVFGCPELPRVRIVNIAAHELVHQLAHDYYGDAHLSSDLILLEGVATWGAGDYWLAGQPNFRAFVAEYAAAGSLLPLATHYSGRSASEMNQLYYQWAAFVEFLLQRDGRDRFDQLYRSGNSSPGSAAYEAIYGADLATLEREWQTWLLGN